MNDPLYEEASSPDFDIAGQVGDLVERLREGQLAKRSDELARLMGEGTATEAQKAEYREITASLATAKSGNPSPEARSKL